MEAATVSHLVAGEQLGALCCEQHTASARVGEQLTLAMQRQKQRRKGVNELWLVLLPLHLLLAAVAPSGARLLFGCYREQHHNASISSV